MEKETCQCCGYKSSTFKNPPHYKDHCVICFWKNDPLQIIHPDSYIANGKTLRQAQKNFIESNVLDKPSMNGLRKPNKYLDEKDLEWKPLDLTIEGKNTYKYTCACCGFKSLYFFQRHDICEICRWQDDSVQKNNPFYVGGANHISLEKAQKNFIRFGACDKKNNKSKYIRKPNSEDIFDKPIDVSKYTKIHLKDILKLFKILNIDTSLILDLDSDHSIEKETNLRVPDGELYNLLVGSELIDKLYTFSILYNIDFYRDKPKAIGNSELLNLNDDEVKEQINHIRQEFRDYVNKTF